MVNRFIMTMLNPGLNHLSHYPERPLHLERIRCMYRLIPIFTAVHVVGEADDALIPKRNNRKEREGNPIRMENGKVKSLENRKNGKKVLR